MAEAKDPLRALPINSLLPHRLSKLCQATNSRLVQISTDCVFSGSKGNYTENDFSDANDLYGRSKFLGEVNYSNTITLCTSIIGHELFGGDRVLVIMKNSSLKDIHKYIFLMIIPHIILKD